MRNIVLIGMRGSGKSQIGKALAKKLKLQFVDLDEEVEKQASMNISQIVAEHGWEHFRQLEHEAVKKFSSKTNLVIATGGGVILKKENVELLKQKGTMILLEAPIQVIAERIMHSHHRPSLTGADFVKELNDIWQERQIQYKSAADFVINVSANSNNPSQDMAKKVDQIIEKIS